MHHCGQMIQTANTVSGILKAIYPWGYFQYNFYSLKKLYFKMRKRWSWFKDIFKEVCWSYFLNTFNPNIYCVYHLECTHDNFNKQEYIHTSAIITVERIYFGLYVLYWLKPQAEPLMITFSICGLWEDN